MGISFSLEEKRKIFLYCYAFVGPGARGDAQGTPGFDLTPSVVRLLDQETKLAALFKKSGLVIPAGVFIFPPGLHLTVADYSN